MYHSAYAFIFNRPKEKHLKPGLGSNQTALVSLDGSQEAAQLAGVAQEVPQAAGLSGPAGQPSGPDFDSLAKHCDFG